MKLSNDISILKDLVVKLLTRIETLEQENAALKAENAELRLRLKQNSGNSHRPPSADGLHKKPAFNQSKGKKTGGQIGHKGKTLSMVSNPDRTGGPASYRPSCCFLSLLFKSDVSHISQKRQVFDIPQPRLEITEHQLGVITCFGEAHQGLFPDRVHLTQPV